MIVVQGCATFDGNGNTISNLYARGGSGRDDLGLFGHTGSGAILRNIGIINNKLYGGGDRDFAGGLVSWNRAAISASYATGNVDGGDGNNDSVGGLVGSLARGALIGTITASYATGNADGGAGNSDLVGGPVGTNNGITIKSYGFGTAIGETIHNNSHPNSAVTSAGALTAATDGSDTLPAAGNTFAGLEWKDSASVDWDWVFGSMDGSINVGNPNPVLKVDFNGDGTSTVAEFGGQTNSYPTVASGHNTVDQSGYTHVDTGDPDVDQIINIASVFTDSDSGDTLVITASSSDSSHVSVKSVTRSSLVLTVEAGTNTGDSAIITVTANDGKGGIVSDTFTVTLQ